MVAIMTQCLELAPTHRVLEIGTGSGYQTALLAKLAAHVYTVERIGHLSEQAQANLSEVKIQNVSFRVGDGTLGWADHAPYDRILVTAGAPAVGQALVDQLVDGGLLVVPVGAPDEQVLTVVHRQGDRTIEKPSIACRFVKLIGKGGWD
jgi:protein-L-isoaspartate(D-aspartate) O-methyltransferase